MAVARLVTPQPPGIHKGGFRTPVIRTSSSVPHQRREPVATGANSVEQGITGTLIDAEALAARAREIGAAIDRDYAGCEPVLVVVLQGALIFAADLMRGIGSHVQLGSVAISSYPTGTRATQPPSLTADLQLEITGRDVILVEDIVDSGRTIRALLDHLAERQPASICVASCLDKPARRKVEVPLRYVGFEVPPVFVVGYGLDYSGRYRNLPYVAVLGEGVAEEMRGAD